MGTFYDVTDLNYFAYFEVKIQKDKHCLVSNHFWFVCVLFWTFNNNDLLLQIRSERI